MQRETSVLDHVAEHWSEPERRWWKKQPWYRRVVYVSLEALALLLNGLL